MFGPPFHSNCLSKLPMDAKNAALALIGIPARFFPESCYISSSQIKGHTSKFPKPLRAGKPSPPQPKRDNATVMLSSAPKNMEGPEARQKPWKGLKAEPSMQGGARLGKAWCHWKPILSHADVAIHVTTRANIVCFEVKPPTHMCPPGGLVVFVSFLEFLQSFVPCVCSWCPQLWFKPVVMCSKCSFRSRRKAVDNTRQPWISSANLLLDLLLRHCCLTAAFRQGMDHLSCWGDSPGIWSCDLQVTAMFVRLAR